tara:strand:- start:351 stop:551 length:201 start_codon:yes stop_codon:yes gene_type:complete
MSEGRVYETIIQKPMNFGETGVNCQTSHHEHNPYCNSEASDLFTFDISGRRHFKSAHTDPPNISFF